MRPLRSSAYSKRNLTDILWLKKQNTRPTAEDSARRLIILKHVVVSVLASPPREVLEKMTANWGTGENDEFRRKAEAQREQFWQSLHNAGLWQYLSPREKTHARATMLTMTDRQQIDGYWRLEAAQTLMWALGMLQNLPPFDTAADPELLKQVPVKEVTSFIQSARLRSAEELDTARDTAELWHWRSRTRELIERNEVFPDDPNMKAAGLNSFADIVRFSARNAAQEGTIPPCVDDDFPAKGKAYRNLTEEEWSEVRSITVERHFALNWLCGHAPGNQWDDTPTDT